MILGSHNSWSYLPVKKWWMKPIAFTARCQRKTIKEQYELGVRCFDLRVRFDGDKLIVAHSIVEYKIYHFELMWDLEWLNERGDCYVRLLHETRTKRQHSHDSVMAFQRFCYNVEKSYPNIEFFCGRNLYDWFVDFYFESCPSVDEKYSSVCKPRILDDWWPWLYARLHNKEIREQGTAADILLIDYVNIK